MYILLKINKSQRFFGTSSLTLLFHYIPESDASAGDEGVDKECWQDGWQDGVARMGLGHDS